MVLPCVSFRRFPALWLVAILPESPKVHLPYHQESAQFHLQPKIACPDLARKQAFALLIGNDEAASKGVGGDSFGVRLFTDR
jgi:hypothetical protein